MRRRVSRICPVTSSANVSAITRTASGPRRLTSREAVAVRLEPDAFDAGVGATVGGVVGWLIGRYGGLSRLRTGVRTVHLAEILAATQDGATATGARVTDPAQAIA